MTTDMRIVGITGLYLVAMSVAGCTQPWCIRTQGKGEVCTRFVSIDVVGIIADEKDDWMKPSLRDYWLGSRSPRQKAYELGELSRFRFGPQERCEFVVSEKDSVWKKWKYKKATHFVMLVDACAENQTWRVCLPLSAVCWKGQVKDREIQININSNGIDVATKPKPGCE